MNKIIVMDLEQFEIISSKVIEAQLQKFLPALAKANEKVDEPLKTRRELAKELNVSLVTLNTWKNEGLPYHRQKRRVYFLKSEVLDYMHTNKRKK